MGSCSPWRSLPSLVVGSLLGRGGPLAGRAARLWIPRRRNVLPWAASEDWAASKPGDALTPRSIATARIPRSSYNVYALSVQRQLTRSAADQATSR
jgi:hypothetical protein